MTPKQPKQTAHNGKQGNATRLELFIALKYLLDKCPDEKNTSKTLELQEYAKENFGVLLDRRRVNDIFDSLVDFTQNNRGVIPYVVKKVEDKPRYYIKKDLFSNKEIESIAKAIQNDPSISSTRANKYIDSFLNVVCSKADKDKIDKKLKRTEVHKMRASELENEFQEYFSYLRDTQKRFYFKFKQPIRPGDCTDKSFCKQVQKDGPNKEYAGIVFDLYTIKKQVDVCIYLPDLRCAIIAHQQDIEINLGFEPVEQLNTVSFYVGEQTTLSEWVKHYYKGETGLVYPIRFAFPAGNKNTILEKMIKSFKNFFDEPLQFELKERTFEKSLPNGGIEKETITDVVALTKHNYESFRKWFWEGDFRPYEVVVVLFPAAFNDRLMGPITRRFQSRLDNFGYDSERGQAERDYMEKKIEEMRKKKEAEASNESEEKPN